MDLREPPIIVRSEEDRGDNYLIERLEAQREYDIKWFQDWLKEEVGKMEVIRDEERLRAIGVPESAMHDALVIQIDTLASTKSVAQAQLEDSKKSLLDKIKRMME